MELEGVKAPFELVVEGADKVVKELDKLAKKAASLERLKVGGKGVDFDVSGVEKSLDSVDQRLAKSLMKLQQFKMPRSLKGTDIGDGLGAVFDKGVDANLKRIGSLNAGLAQISEALYQVQNAAANRTFPVGEAQKFQSTIKNVSSEIYRMGMAAEKSFAKSIDAMRTSSSAAASMHYAQGGAPAPDNRFADVKLSTANMVTDLSDNFNSDIAHITQTLKGLGETPVSFDMVGAALVGDLNSAFKDVRTKFKTTVGELAGTIRELNLAEVLASEILSPQVTDAINSLHENLTKLEANKLSIKTTSEALDNPELGTEERSFLAEQLKIELSEAAVLTRKVAEDNKAMGDSFFSHQRSLVAAAKAGAATLGAEFSATANAIQNIADNTSNFKREINSSLTDLGLGVDVLRQQELVNKRIVDIIKAGGEAESELIAEALNGVDAYKQTMRYAQRLEEVERKIASARNTGNDALETSATLLREQANALRGATMTGNGAEALAALDKLQQVEKTLGEKTAKLSIRDSIIDISKEINSGAIPSLGRLEQAITQYESTSGKKFSTQTTDVQMLGKSLDTLVSKYNMAAKATTRASVAEQQQALAAIESLNARVQDGGGSGTDKARNEIRKQMVASAKAELAVTEQQIGFEDEMVNKFNKIQALRVAGVKEATSYTELQKLYIEAKGRESAIEDVIVSKLRNKASVVRKLAHEVEGMVAISGDIELIPEMQVAQLKGALETLELMRTITQQMSANGNVMAKDTNGDEINVAAIDKQITSIKENLYAREQITAEAAETRRIDESIDGVLKSRAKMEREIVNTLREANAALDNHVSSYETYQKASDAVVTAARKNVDVGKEGLRLDELREAAVKELYTDFTRLQKMNFSTAGPTEALKAFEQMRKILLEVGDIADRDYTLNIDGKDVTVSLGKIRTELAKTENRMMDIENGWTDVQKTFMKFDPYPLRKQEGQIKAITESISGMGNETKGATLGSVRDFGELNNAVVKTETPLTVLRNAMKSLHVEQLKNSAATDEERIATSANLAVVQRQTAAVTALKKALQTADSSTMNAGISLPEMMDNPQAAIDKISGDPKKIKAVEAALQYVSKIVEDMTIMGGQGGSPIFATLTNHVKELDVALKGARDSMSQVLNKTTSIDLSTVSTTPEQTSNTKVAEEQKLLQTIKDEYLALQQGVDVNKNWESIRKNVNEAFRRGLDLGKENIAVLNSQDKVFITMAQHAKELMVNSKDSNAPIEARTAALLEAEQIIKNVKSGLKGMGSEAGFESFDKALATIDKMKEKLGYVPEGLRKATEQAEIFHGSLIKSVNSISDTEAKGGEAYQKIGTDITRIVGSLADWRKAQESIYRNADFITKSSDKDISNKRQQVREAERIEATMKKIAKLSDSISDKSNSVGVDPSTLGTAQGAAALNHATVKDPKLFVDIMKANKEMQGLMASLSSTIGSSEKLKAVFGSYDDELKKSLTELQRVDAAMNKYAATKQRKAANSAGSSIFDVFRMAWFVQLRAFWEMYMGITEVMQAVMEYTHTMNVMKGVTQASAETMGALNDQFSKLGKTVPIALAKTSEAALQVAKAGMDAKETMHIIGAASKLAYATKSDLTIVADVITVVVRSWGLAAENADQIAGTLFAAISKSRASMEGLQQAMGYLSGIAPQANVSLEQTLGLVGVLTNAGLSMSKAATYSRQVLNDLMNPSAKLTAILGSMGVALADVDPRFNSLAKIFKRLSDAGMDVSQAFEGMSVRGANAFAIALGNADMIDAFTKSLDGAGDLMREYPATTKDLVSEFQLLMNSFVDVGNHLKTVLGPAVSGVVTLLRGLANGLSVVLVSLGKLSNMGGNHDVLMGFAKGLAVIAPLVALAVTGGTLSAFGKGLDLIKVAATAAGTQVTILGRAMVLLRAIMTGLAAHPIMAVILGLSAIGYAVYSMTADSVDYISELTESVRKLGEEIKQINTLKLDIKRAESTGNRIAVADEMYGADSEADLSTKGKRENARAISRGVLSDAIQNGTPEMQEVARKLMDEMFDPAEGEEVAQAYVKNMLEVMRAVVDKSTVDMSNTLKLKVDSQNDELTIAAENAAKAMGALREAANDFNSVDMSETSVLLDQLIPKFGLLGMLVGKVGGEFVKTSKETLLAFKTQTKEFGDVASRLGAAIEATPVAAESVPQLLQIQKVIATLNEVMSGLITEAQRAGKTLPAEFTKVAKAVSRMNADMPNKITVAQNAGTTDEQSTKSLAKSKEATKSAKTASITGLNQDISTQISGAESAAGGLKYAVQLAFLAPSAKNVDEVKKRMSLTAEKINTLMQRIGDENAEQSMFSLKQDDGKALMDAMQNSWDAQLEMLKTFDKDGNITFKDLMGAAYKLNKELNFKDAGISFTNMIRKFGIGKDALQDLKTQARDVPLESYTQLGEKLDYIASTWQDMKKVGAAAMDPKYIAEAGALVEKLTKKQFDYMKSVMGTRNSIRSSVNSYNTLSGALVNMGMVYDELSGMSVGDMVDAPRNMGAELTDQFIEMRNTIKNAKEDILSVTGDVAIVSAELAKLGEITGQNSDTAMDTEKAYASLASTAESKLKSMQGAIQSTVEKMGTLQKAIQDANKEMASQQFSYQERRRDVGQSMRGNETDFSFEQAKMQRKSTWIQSQADNGNLKDDELISAIAGLRDEFIGFAEANPYQQAGQDSLGEADRLNTIVIAMQQRRKMIAELRLKIAQNAMAIQLATFKQMASITEGIHKVLLQLSTQIGSMGTSDAKATKSTSVNAKSTGETKTAKVTPTPASGKATATPDIANPMAGISPEMARLTKQSDDYIAQLNALEKQSVAAGKAADIMTNSMAIQERKALSTTAALTTWASTIPEQQQTVQNMFSSMMDTIKGTVSSTISGGLRSWAEGGDFDINDAIYEMNWKLIDEYIAGVTDMGAKSLFEKDRGTASFKALTDSKTDTVAKGAEATGAGIMGEGIAGTDNTAPGALTAAATTLQSAATALQQVATNMGAQATQEAAMSGVENTTAITEATTAMQDASTAPQAAQAAQATSQAAQETSQAASALQGAAASGGGSESGGFGSGFMGFMGGVGGMASKGLSMLGGLFRHEGGLISDGNKQKDSTTVNATKGEYMIQEPIVRKLGVEFFNSLNAGKTEQAFEKVPNMTESTVNGSGAKASNVKPPESRPAPAAASGSQGKQSMRINNIVDPQVVEKFLNTNRGKKAVTNVVSTNPYKSRG